MLNSFIIYQHISWPSTLDGFKSLTNLTQSNSPDIFLASAIYLFLMSSNIFDVHCTRAYPYKFFKKGGGDDILTYLLATVFNRSARSFVIGEKLANYDDEIVVSKFSMLYRRYIAEFGASTIPNF